MYKSKEEEILARQRAVAAKLSGITVNPKPPPPSSSSIGDNKDKIKKGNDSKIQAQQRLLAQSNQRNRLSSILQRQQQPSSSSASRLCNQPKKQTLLKQQQKIKDIIDLRSPEKNVNHKKISNVTPSSVTTATAIKRPPMRRSGTASTQNAIAKQTTAETALAAARNRLGIKTQPISRPSTSANTSGSTFKRATMRSRPGNNTNSAATSRPAPNTAGSSAGGANNVVKAGLTASILSKSGVTTQELANTKYERVHPTVEIEDYWRNVRSWDFLKDLNNSICNQRQGAGGNNRNKNGKHKDKTQPLKRQKVKDLFSSMEGRGTMETQRVHRKQNHKDTINTVSSNSDKSNSREAINNNTSNSAKDKDSNQQQEHQQLPTSFTSYKQYKALWGPLCLAEARAQLLQEISSDIPYWNKNKNGVVVPVSVSSLEKDVSNGLDFITLQVRPCGNNNGGNRGDWNSGPSFFANDIVMLTTEEKYISMAAKGSLQDLDFDNEAASEKGCNKNSSSSPTSLPRMCILGHTEYSRRTIDGLQLKVSRKLWPSVSSSADKMYLLRLGGNVTALREFTALCHVDSLPLLSPLLCNKMMHSDGDNGGSSKAKHCKLSSSLLKGSSSENKSAMPEADDKGDLLDNMGGKAALGKGFTSYARKKFNSSQLGAISAAATEYGSGGFTLVKGPPGTGKTTTLVALLNSLHIRQFNKYFEQVRKIAAENNTSSTGAKKTALANAAKGKPRLLVCAPSNAAVDNVILKIMENGFIDGNGCRYNPSIVRVGVGQSSSVKDVSLDSKVDHLMSDAKDLTKIEDAIAGYKMELSRTHNDIARLRRRIRAIAEASPWPLQKEWEIRVDSNFEENGKVYFVNHKMKTTTYECPPAPEPGVKSFRCTAMPEYRSFMSQVVKLVERYNNISTKLERCSILQRAGVSSASGHNQTIEARQQLETHILDSTHVVMTTLGTAGNRALDSAAKFEVVVVDEAAQSVEPATLVSLQLGSSHAILVGDPQQLPATIFSVSGRSTKYDRSLFQRLEEAGHPVHLLDTQYRMHPAISEFPRHIFYSGDLRDGPNVKHPEYGNPLRRKVLSQFPAFQPFTILDLDSSEERGGTSLANSAEARLALHLYKSLAEGTEYLSAKSRVAIITPYSQQAALLRRTFSQDMGQNYEKAVEVNTVDAFQGREANIVIFSCVRASGSRGIGFLSDVRRMNVALTRAKHFLFVIARCESIVVNPYWRDLVRHARENEAVVRVPMGGRNQKSFPDLHALKSLPPLPKEIVPIRNKRKIDILIETDTNSDEDGEVSRKK